MKTLKVKDGTHKILKWIQTQEMLMNEKFHDQDAVIFKALVQYAKVMNYNLLALREIIEIDGDK